MNTRRYRVGARVMHISAPPSLATRFHKIANDAVPPPLFDPFQSMPPPSINAKFISSPSFEFLASPFFVCVTRMKGNIACILSVYASSKPEIRSDASVGLGSILRSIRRKGKGEEERTTLSVVASVTRSVVARRTSPSSSFLNVIRVSSIRDSSPPPVNIVRSHRAIRHRRTSLRSSHYIP